MIQVKIKKWKPIAGIEHVSTSWVLSKDKEGREVLENHPNSHMLELFISKIEIPKDVTYYVTATRHFNNPDVDYVIDTVPVSNIKQTLNNMLLKEDPYVETPYLRMNKEDLRNGLPTLRITSSKFRSNVDVWLSSSFFILNPSREILYSKLDVEDEGKKGIDIPNLDVFKQYPYLYLGIIHRGSSGVESALNFTRLDLSGIVNYIITTPLYNVKVLEDLDIIFKPVNDGDNLRINRVEICDRGSLRTLQVLTKVAENIYRVPKGFLKAGAKYKIKVFKATMDGKDNEPNYHDLEVSSSIYEVIKSDNYKYQYELHQYPNDTGVVIPENIITEGMYNTNIFIPNSNTLKLDTYIMENNSKYLPILRPKNVSANGIELLSHNIEGFMFRPLEKDLVLIDAYNEFNLPTFYVYRFNIEANSFTLENKLTRDTETKCLGHTGSLVRISKDEIIYNPVGTNKLVMYNVLSNARTELQDIPLTHMEYGLLIRNKNNRLYAGNCTDFKAVIYNYHLLEYTEGYFFGPANFLNNENVTLGLINGDALVVNKDFTRDGKHAVSHYHFHRGDFKHIESRFDVARPFSFVIGTYGEVLMFGRETEKLQFQEDWEKHTLWCYR